MAFSDEMIHSHGLELDTRLAGVGPGEQEKAIHDLGQPLNFVEKARQEFPLIARAMLLAQRQLQFPTHDGEGSLQFVGRVKREIPNLCEGLMKSSRHAVEDPGEAVQFVMGTGLNE